MGVDWRVRGGGGRGTRDRETERGGEGGSKTFNMSVCASETVCCVGIMITAMYM